MRPRPPYDDETWEMVVAAAAPHVPDAVAREVFNKCLYDFDQMGLDLPQLKKWREGWKQAASQASEAADTVTRIRDRRHFLGGWSDDDQGALLGLRSAQRHALQRVEELNALIGSQQGRRNARRDWLHRQLLDIWQNHFGGRLAISANPKTRKPGARWFGSSWSRWPPSTSR